MVLSTRSVASVIVGLSLVGCYTLQPAGGAAPRLGSKVAFDVNDAGRVALGGSAGPEISQIEGRLIENSNGEYVLAVSSVRLLRGGEQVWEGEKVRIKPEHVSSTYERRFSRSRTVALAALGVGSLAYMLTRSLTGSGSEDPDKFPGDTAQTQISPVP